MVIEISNGKHLEDIALQLLDGVKDSINWKGPFVETPNSFNQNATSISNILPKFVQINNNSRSKFILEVANKKYLCYFVYKRIIPPIEEKIPLTDFQVIHKSFSQVQMQAMDLDQSNKC